MIPPNDETMEMFRPQIPTSQQTGQCAASGLEMPLRKPVRTYDLQRKMNLSRQKDSRKLFPTHNATWENTEGDGGWSWSKAAMEGRMTGVDCPDLALELMVA